MTLADVTTGGATGGGAWNRDDVILFLPKAGPLYRLSASSGTPSPVTTLDAGRGETAHVYPFFLPDRRHFLYLARGSAVGGTATFNALGQRGLKR